MAAQSPLLLLALAVLACAAVASAAYKSSFCYRTIFTYKLLNNSTENLMAVQGNLTAALYNVTNMPISWAFGPDMGLQPKLGYSALNTDFGGFLDFETLEDLQAYYKEFFNNSYWLAYKPLLNPSGTTRIQTLHTLGSDISLKKGQITALSGYGYAPANDTGFILGEAIRVLSNVSLTAPSPPIAFYEVDLSMHDILYPANSPNFDLGIKHTFGHQADVISHYRWALTSPERNRVARIPTSTYRIQFQINNINPNLPNGAWGPKESMMSGGGGMMRRRGMKLSKKM